MNALERAGYLAHAKTGLYKRVSEATRIAERLAEVGCQRPYVSLSFGKDSIVMTHLLLQVWPDLPVLYVDCGEFDEWPDTPRVKQRFLEVCPCDLHTLSGPSIITAYRQVGYVYTQDEEQEPAARRAQHEYGASLGKVIDTQGKRLGCDGAFLGLRTEESNNRRRLVAIHGDVYYNRERGMWVCCPLAYWTGRDVWAYIVLHDLPYNELYDLHPDGRERARNGAMIGTRSERYGRLTFLRRMYPEWWRRFVMEFPEVAHRS